MACICGEYMCKDLVVSKALEPRHGLVIVWKLMVYKSGDFLIAHDYCALSQDFKIYIICVIGLCISAHLSLLSIT